MKNKKVCSLNKVCVFLAYSPMFVVLLFLCQATAFSAQDSTQDKPDVLANPANFPQEVALQKSTSFLIKSPKGEGRFELTPGKTVRLMQAARNGVLVEYLGSTVWLATENTDFEKRVELIRTQRENNAKMAIYEERIRRNKAWRQSKNSSVP